MFSACWFPLAWYDKCVLRRAGYRV